MIIYSIPNCKWCDRAKELLSEYGYDYEDRDWYAPAMWEWEEMMGAIPKTAPQIFEGDHYIGGYVDLVEYLES